MLSVAALCGDGRDDGAFVLDYVCRLVISPRRFTERLPSYLATKIIVLAWELTVWNFV